MSRKAWLVCGAISSLLYVGADLLAAALYPGYHSFTSQAISELTAVGAPTKGLVEPLLIVYDILIIAFGVGVWRSAGRKRVLRMVGGPARRNRGGRAGGDGLEAFGRPHSPIRAG